MKKNEAFTPSLHDFNEHRNVFVCVWHHLCLYFYHTGTQVYILNGTDPEGDPVRYGLTFEQGSKEFFRADSKSGNVTLIQELDREVRLLMRLLFFWRNLLSVCHHCGSMWHLLLFVETRWNLSAREHNGRSQQSKFLLCIECFCL